MPVPKKKVSKRRRDMRRSHDALKVPNLVACGTCTRWILPHVVCPHCGYYREKQVLEVGAGQ